MDLVVCYSTTEWEDVVCEHTICCQYESPEHFLIEFEEKLVATKNKNAENCKVRKEWLSNQPRLARFKGRKAGLSAQEKYDRDMKSWQEQKPEMVDDVSFDMAGKKFFFWWFYKMNHITGEYFSYTLPQVYELQEWFNVRLQDSGV